MNDFMLELALRHFGFTDPEIAKIKYVISLVQHNKTVLAEVIEMFTAKLKEMQ